MITISTTILYDDDEDEEKDCAEWKSERVEPTPSTLEILTAFWLHFIFIGYNVLQHLPCEGTGDGDFDNRFKSVKWREREREKNEWN